MFLNSQGPPLFAGRTRARARESWREAADLVATRWETFVQADGPSRRCAFAAYIAALDAEEAAASRMAAVAREAV